MLQLEDAREEEMVAEAATVEAVWVVEPPTLEGLLEEEISAYFAEQVSMRVNEVNISFCISVRRASHIFPQSTFHLP